VQTCALPISTSSTNSCGTSPPQRWPRRKIPAGTAASLPALSQALKLPASPWSRPISKQPSRARSKRCSSSACCLRSTWLSVDVRVGAQVLENLLPLLLVDHEIEPFAVVQAVHAALILHEPSLQL